MKLLIVDDDPLVRQSLQLLLGQEEDFETVGTAGNGREAIAACERELPDAILLDIRMPAMDGIECLKAIKNQWPSIRVMMLTTFRDEHNIRTALKAGAEGYLLKSMPVENMAQQIRALQAGTAILDAEVLKAIVEPGGSKLAGLTDRERDIAELVAQGLSNKEIADRLFLSVGTVRNVLSVLLDKLELRDRTQLAIYYWQR